MAQVFILCALTMYGPPNKPVAEVMMKFMDRVQNPEMVLSLCKKMTPPLVTLLSAENEVQCVVLRNINLMVPRFSSKTLGCSCGNLTALSREA